MNIKELIRESLQTNLHESGKVSDLDTGSKKYREMFKANQSRVGKQLLVDDGDGGWVEVDNTIVLSTYDGVLYAKTDSSKTITLRQISKVNDKSIELTIDKKVLSYLTKV